MVWPVRGCAKQRATGKLASHMDAPLFQLLLLRRYYANQQPSAGKQASLTAILFYFNNADDDDGNFRYKAQLRVDFYTQTDRPTHSPFLFL